jgi:ketosteroid isomerase-like protein
MSELSDLIKRVERLEARNAISELVTAYAVACDEHDLARLETLFTDDICFESASGVLRSEGKEAVMAMFARVLATRGPGYHWTHDHVITIDPGDEDCASGSILSHAETTPDGKPSLAAMRYADRYVRVGGKWKFRSRKLSFFYYLPVHEYAQTLNNLARVTVGREKCDADFPEKLPSWQEFERAHGGIHVQGG